MRRFTWLLIALCACSTRKPELPFQTRSAGSLALANDDAQLYIVDGDSERLLVFDTAVRQKMAEVKVGRSPERVAVGPDGRIWVTNRGERTVSMIRPGAWEVAGTVSVGVEPAGIQVSPDGSTVFVVNGASTTTPESGSLMAIDAETLAVQWELPVGHEPRGVRLLEGNRAVVTLLQDGELVEVDLGAPKVLRRTTGIHDLANATELRNRNGQATFQARNMTDAAVTADGKLVYAPVVWARETRIALPPSTSGGYYQDGGPCGGGPVASAGLLTFEADTLTPLVDDLGGCFGTADAAGSFPNSALVGGGTNVVQGTVAAAVDATGEWLFLVNRESENVAVMPAQHHVDVDSSGSVFPAPTVGGLVQVGAGANGIALTRDSKRAYVYAAFAHQVEILEAGSGSNPMQLTRRTPVKVAENVLPPEIAEGRRLFFAADDAALSNQTSGISCATCHVEGRDDGHVWRFPDGPRQTPTLAGRKLNETGPYHWSGEFATLTEFLDHTVRSRMGGKGLSPAMVGALTAYIESLPPADNPLRTATPTDAQQRGRTAFEKAGCNACHAGADLTNNGFADVGTLVRSGTDFDDPEKLQHGLNVPSLLGLGRSGPYLHDGSAVTLEERLAPDLQNGRHGQAALLNDAERADLLVYLKSL